MEWARVRGPGTRDSGLKKIGNDGGFELFFQSRVKMGGRS